MDYICEICNEGVEKYPLCLRLTEENVKSMEDRIEFNCCSNCADELSKKISEKCEGMNVKKTLTVLGIDHIKAYKNKDEKGERVMKNNGKITESGKVYGMDGLHLVDL